MVDPRVTAAVRHGGVGVLDGRGLMRLADARALVASTSVFARGDDDAGAGHAGVGRVLPSDRLWAALLSLADVDEFAREASRLTWAFHPRGFDNVDLHRRYGDGIVRWLATRVGADGVLASTPWCVVPCLLACGDAAAFALAWGVARVEGASIDLLRTWCDRHPAAAAAELAARLPAPRAAAHLAGLRWRHPDLPLPAPARPASASDILAHLDGCALELTDRAVRAWPALGGRGASTLHGVRAVAARVGDAWGLVLERIEGDRATGVQAARALAFGYGADVAGGAIQRARPLILDGAPAAGPAFVAWLRARLAAAPDGVLGPPAAALAAVGLGGGATVVAVVDDLALVDPAERLPSATLAVRALAAALAG
ncbi:MAG: hypothetical protein IPL61_30270 [Myxococcales bacterium]|nr:hypothetical protein [Myxococcales bacterium]